MPTTTLYFRFDKENPTIAKILADNLDTRTKHVITVKPDTLEMIFYDRIDRIPEMYSSMEKDLIGVSIKESHISRSIAPGIYNSKSLVPGRSDDTAEVQESIEWIYGGVENHLCRSNTIEVKARTLESAERLLSKVLKGHARCVVHYTIWNF